MNSRVGRLGGHSHDARNLTFLFRSREATTHRVYLNEVDTQHALYKEARDQWATHMKNSAMLSTPSG